MTYSVFRIFLQIFQARPSRGVMANALTWLHQGNRSMFNYAIEFWIFAADSGWNQVVMVDTCILEGVLPSHRGATHRTDPSISKRRISSSDYGERFSSSAPAEDEGTNVDGPHLTTQEALTQHSSVALIAFSMHCFWPNALPTCY